MNPTQHKINKIAVIMAGGLGLKLWPRSTEKKPKQFSHFIGEETLIQNTIVRLLPLFKPEDIYVVSNNQFKKHLEEQIAVLPKENILYEPFPQNTAPCAALAATTLKNKYPEDTIMCVFPADHVIHNVREFHMSIDMAAKIAYEKKAKVTIGIPPIRPECAYGYIQINNDRKNLGDYYENGVRYTQTFAEKPDLKTARRFMESGDFLWNSGMFIWRMDTFWSGVEKYLPEHFQLFKVLAKYTDTDKFEEMTDSTYRQMEAVSLDYGILEKSDNVIVIEATFSWSDLGNWDELYRLSLKDARNNYIEGDVLAIDTRNCLTLSNGKMIGIIGVEDLIVVDSDDALLICKRKHSENVNELIDLLKRKQINSLL